MKKILKKIVPKEIKLQIKIVQNFFQDINNQNVYSKKYQTKAIGDFEFIVKQPIKDGQFFENKIHNLKIVNQKINNLIINPNEVFSFWRLIGKPTEKKGFKKGRNLIEGKISDDYGGGICQYSSILYHLALQNGLEILERHPHTLDIYKENERFTPLGADATVVYAYKDLQFKNIFNFSIQLKGEIIENEIKLKLIAKKEIDFKEIDFIYKAVEKGVWVETLQSGNKLFNDYYKRL